MKSTDKVQKGLDNHPRLTKSKIFNRGVGKLNLLNAFENEYKAAFKKEQKLADGKEDGELTSAVINKYMDMKTDLFDADDLNEIIDRVEGE